MKTQQPELFNPSTLKRLTVLSNVNKSREHLKSGNCGLFFKDMMKYCLICLIATVITASLLYGNGAYEDEATILEAYELRLSGKADEALTLLNEMLEHDSTNALAYVELARTKQHLMLGGQQIPNDEIVNAWQQAVRYAPENGIYAFYYATSCFNDAYLSLMLEQPDAIDKVTRTCDAFRAVLELNPDCHEASLYLVDIYGVLPEEMGGDREKAESYAAALEQKDKLYGAMARSRLLPESADQVSYWEEFVKETGANAQLLEELGRAYLFQSDTENGTEYFQDAIQTDVTKRYLMMNLIRYHLMSGQQNPDQRNEHLKAAEELANGYLNSKPELTPPQKAHTYQMLALIKNFSGDQNSRNKFLETAASLDPYYSRASGVPAEMLYCPPDEVKIQYSSYFYPF